MPLIAPLIHANGDSAATLLTALEAQYDALDAALQVMRRARPNSRNYTAETYGPADDQHSARMRALVEVQDALAEEIAAIEAQRR